MAKIVHRRTEKSSPKVEQRLKILQNKLLEFSDLADIVGATRSPRSPKKMSHSPRKIYKPDFKNFSFELSNLKLQSQIISGESCLSTQKI
jgi:hypothetical protein